MTGSKDPRFNRHSNLSILTVIVLAVLCFHSCCCGADEKTAGYLFAHMMKSDYGRLYYSVSTDGLHWTLLNNGKRVSKDYRGHPDICRGHDGRFYLTGGSDKVSLWISDTAAPRLRSLPALGMIFILRITMYLRVPVMVV